MEFSDGPKVILMLTPTTNLALSYSQSVVTFIILLDMAYGERVKMWGKTITFYKANAPGKF